MLFKLVRAYLRQSLLAKKGVHSLRELKKETANDAENGLVFRILLRVNKSRELFFFCFLQHRFFLVVVFFSLNIVLLLIC